jgi:hypothetical protein
VDAAEGDILPGDHDHAGGRDAALNADGVGGRLGRRACRAGAAQPGGIGRGERAGPGAQQDPGCGIAEHQNTGLDADADKLPGEDFPPASDGGQG